MFFLNSTFAFLSPSCFPPFYSKCQNKNGPLHDTRTRSRSSYDSNKVRGNKIKQNRGGTNEMVDHEDLEGYVM